MFLPNIWKWLKSLTILIFQVFYQIKSQIKSWIFKLIENQIKSSEYDFKSRFSKSQIKSLNTLIMDILEVEPVELELLELDFRAFQLLSIELTSSSFLIVKKLKKNRCFG